MSKFANKWRNTQAKYKIKTKRIFILGDSNFVDMYLLPVHILVFKF